MARLVLLFLSWYQYGPEKQRHVTVLSNVSGRRSRARSGLLQGQYERGAEKVLTRTGKAEAAGLPLAYPIWIGDKTFFIADPGGSRLRPVQGYHYMHSLYIYMP